MIEIGDTAVNIVRNCIPMRNFMPASAYGLKAISDWFVPKLKLAKVDPFEKYPIGKDAPSLTHPRCKVTLAHICK